MSSLGVGFMIGYLSGNEATIQALEYADGKIIRGIRIDPDRGDGTLIFTFDDGEELHVFDAGRSCCEIRYLHTEDNLEEFIGATFIEITIKQAPTETGGLYGDDVSEMVFLGVRTSMGEFTVESHNQHNGYYGGILPNAFYLKDGVDVHYSKTK